MLWFALLFTVSLLLNTTDSLDNDAGNDLLKEIKNEFSSQIRHLQENIEKVSFNHLYILTYFCILDVELYKPIVFFPN